METLEKASSLFLCWLKIRVIHDTGCGDLGKLGGASIKLGNSTNEQVQ